jgi:hypothetical protein
VPDLIRIQQTILKANIPGVQKLNARQSGNAIEIHGQADSMDAKQAVMRLITDKHGGTGLLNRIEVLSLTAKRIVDNRQRPAQPEPGEDPAAKKVPVREQGTRPNPKPKKK